VIYNAFMNKETTGITVLAIGILACGAAMYFMCVV
jgi:hypothetical protein